MARQLDPDANLRRLRARLGGLALAAQRDPSQYTKSARSAFLSRFEVEVDPERSLPEAERQRRSAAARRLYFCRLALKSAEARRKSAAGAGAPAAEEAGGADAQLPRPT